MIPHRPIADEAHAVEMEALRVSRFITIPIDPELVSLASDLAALLMKDMRNNALIVSQGQDDHIRNSILNGYGILAGFIGELHYQKMFPGSVSANIDQPNYTHDVLHDGRRVEVKTKQRTVQCEVYHDASIAASNPNQNPDLYAFMSVRYNPELMDQGAAIPWLDVTCAGFITPERWRLESRECTRGRLDYKSGDWRFKADCRNLDYYRLIGPHGSEPLPHELFALGSYWMRPENRPT